MNALTAAVVDDEPPARRELQRLLEAAGGVVVIGAAGSVDEAERVLAGAAPDVLFLDIRLGADLGFSVLPSVPAATAVVFVTAHDRFAVRAFEANALDYLLKPVEPRRLAAALERVRAHRARPPARPPADPRASVDINDWLLLRDGPREEFVRVSSIACITADGDYTHVGTADGHTRHVHRSLREWEGRLPAGFKRIHRTAIVNLAHTVAIERGSRRSGTVIVRGQPPLPLSRRESARLKRALPVGNVPVRARTRRK
jgi:two-component system LytT family response regulator